MAIILSYSVKPWRKAMINVSHPKNTLGISGFHPLDGGKTPKILANLRKGWAEQFREEVYPLIPAEEVARDCFCSTNGRPCKDVTRSIGLMILQETYNLTDEEAVKEMRFNLEFHHALRIDDLSDETAYMTRETFWAIKEKIRSKGLQDLIFDRVSMGLAKLHNVDTSHVRLDSVNIKSNMKTLTRGGLFQKTISSFLARLKKSHRDLFDAIDEALVSKYMKPKTGYDVFGGVQPNKRAALLKTMAEDVLTLVRQFQDNEVVGNMQSFINLNRLLLEQYNIVEADGSGAEQVALKEPKEVSADSLQNPSDPDAGYDRHKPKGRHQAQVAETFTPESEPESEPENEPENEPKEQAEGDSKDSKPVKPLKLVIAVKAESAAQHDSHAVLPLIDNLQAKGAEPEVMLADTAYGGDENVEGAALKGVRLVSPVPGKKAGSKDKASEEDVQDEAGSASEDKPSASLTLADFAKDESGRIVSCPEGQQADTCMNKDGEKYISTFDLDKCKACPVKDKCPVRAGKKKASIIYTEKAARIADRRKAQETPEFKKLYRKRSGIEATNSELARKYGIKRLSVRGGKKVSFAVVLKVLAMNVRRTANYVRARMR
jgi:hypothetical protein